MFTSPPCHQQPPYRLKNFKRSGYHFGKILVRWSINKSFLPNQQIISILTIRFYHGVQIIPSINNSFLWLTNRSYGKQLVPTNSNKSFLFKLFRLFFVLLLLLLLLLLYYYYYWSIKHIQSFEEVLYIVV